MTIDQILREAFKRIHDEHRVALRHVYFDTIDASTAARDTVVCRSVQVEADTLRGDPVGK